MMSKGPTVGSTFWHRYSPDTDTFEEQCLGPGVIPDDSWTAGHKPKSLTTRIKTSEALKGRVMGPEWRTKMSAASKGKEKSPEHKKALGDAMREWALKRKEGKV